jgi:hypothetical protein
VVTNELLTGTPEYSCACRAELILRQIGSWSETSWICTDDLQRFRHEHVRSLLEAEKGEITALDQEVLEA